MQVNSTSFLPDGVRKGTSTAHIGSPMLYLSAGSATFCIPAIADQGYGHRSIDLQPNLSTADLQITPIAAPTVYTSMSNHENVEPRIKCPMLVPRI